MIADSRQFQRVISVLAIGAKVTLAGDIDARIAAVIIRENAVEYECVWWVGDDRQTAVVQPFEIDASGGDSVTVGFCDS